MPSLISDEPIAVVLIATIIAILKGLNTDTAHHVKRKYVTKKVHGITIIAYN